MEINRLEVRLGSLTLRNPIMTASGTFGYGEEFADLVDLNRLGAIVVKGVSLHKRPGNPPPRVVETACGMLNAIGLENGGLDTFLAEKIPFLSTLKCAVVVNILGDTVEEYSELAMRLNEVPAVDAIEVNISCPNVRHGGVAFGTSAAMVERVTTEVCRNCAKPVIIKLSPNVTDIGEMARAAEQGGASALSLINTLLGMAIDAKTRRPRLANIVGGLSGPAIKPIALRMVWQVSRSVGIPVIGIGGISAIEDVIEFLLAGAHAVQVGTANLINPSISQQLVKELDDYLHSVEEKSINEIIGKLRT